jgi:hypothetical protein
MSTLDDPGENVKLMEKLQTKHDKLFEKIGFVQREDKQDYTKAYEYYEKIKAKKKTLEKSK